MTRVPGRPPARASTHHALPENVKGRSPTRARTSAGSRSANGPLQSTHRDASWPSQSSASSSRGTGEPDGRRYHRSHMRLLSQIRLACRTTS